MSRDFALRVSRRAARASTSSSEDASVAEEEEEARRRVAGGGSRAARRVRSGDARVRGGDEGGCRAARRETRQARRARQGERWARRRFPGRTRRGGPGVAVTTGARRRHGGRALKFEARGASLSTVRARRVASAGGRRRASRARRGGSAGSDETRRGRRETWASLCDVRTNAPPRVRARQQHVDRSRVVACQVAKIRKKNRRRTRGPRAVSRCQVITKSRFFIYVILMFQSGLV